MHLASRWVGAALALLVQCASSTPTALSVTPSVQWYGDDGTWSAISIRVGTPPQWVDVMVSTMSSETWVVGPGGCNLPSDCATERGGLFNFKDSTSWKEEGFFSLDSSGRLGNGAYGEYGLDNLTFGTTGVTLPNAIIGTINSTGEITAVPLTLGFFGLGIVPGSFNGTNILSAISGLVEDVGSIPSHSYGYTAGAKYQQKGVPNSLTLGGYDANRFVPHNIPFELNPSQSPEVFIDSITVANSSNSTGLVYPTDRVSAVIDSNTPFLWLPKAACDRFAESLGLLYDESLNLYMFATNGSQHDVLQTSSLTFTFSLSDIFSSPNLVNITLPYAAFDLELTYPAIPDTVFGAANSTMFYFPLRQANETQYTIGRSFLQEAYLIIDYERNNFSIHQALHTSAPLQNTSIVSITRPDNSNFSGPPQEPINEKKKLSTAAIVGITIAAVALTALLIFVTLFFCRRRHKKAINNEKPISEPRSLLNRLRRRKPLTHEASGDTSYPTEVGADATHERFELPAPMGPAELDSESGTLDGTTENGSSTQDSAHISAYERARRKLERQRSAAVQGQRSETYPVEKNEADVSEVAHYRAPEIPDIESPLVSPVGPESGGSLTLSGAPSPVSPGFVSSPTSPITAPPPTYRRIDPANVVYAGRLPDNIQLPHIIPRMVGPDGRTITTGTDPSTDPSTLGSHYTENESDDLYESGDTRDHNAFSLPSEPSEPRTHNVSTLPSEPSEERDPQTRQEHSLTDTHLQELLDPWGSRRRLDGEDLVHVPQPAENRFSWEEERTDGTD